VRGGPDRCLPAGTTGRSPPALRPAAFPRASWPGPRPTPRPARRRRHEQFRRWYFLCSPDGASRGARVELGIDLGSSNTVAFLRRGDGPPEQVLCDGSPLLPSAVFCDTDGTLHVGRDALHHARSRPERLEANPKRRIDEGTVYLGQDVEVEQLFAAL